MPNAVNINKLCMGCMSMLENENKPCPKCGYDIQKNVSAPHQLKPYTILNGKYLVGRVLGKGGFGITYLGWDLNLDIKIAIKEYYPAGLVTRETTSPGTSSVTPFTGDKREFYHTGLDKFVNEAKSLAKFYTLPGIVAVKDFFKENGTAYIVMEFVNGITLKQHLANSGGKLRPNEVFHLMRPLMKSLSQIHAEGIIHRDISPDNIMLTNKGDIKLLDFGAARDFVTDGNKSLSVLLKPGYAPEEQYRTKGHQGPWTDVYALCATIYKMITGITPPESLERFSEDGLVPPSKMGIKLSKEAENALLKGLAVFQKNRYQSINALYNDIYGATQWAKPELAYTDMELEQEITRNKASAAIEHAVRTISKSGSGKKKPDAPASSSGYKRTEKKRKFSIIAIGCAALVLISVISIPKLLSAIDYTQTPTGVSSNKKQASPSNSKNTPAANKALTGNTPGNIVNGGLVAQQGDWIYCHNYNDNDYLYKVRTDGTQNTRLNSNMSNFINVVGDWVYYTSQDDALYKIRTDGTQETLLSNNKCLCIHAADDWIYYINEGDNSSIYKIRIDGTSNTKINNNKVSSINVVGDWIYYINQDDNSSIYKIRIDGKQETRVDDSTSRNIVAAGDWIYYINASEGGCLFKVRTDGTDKTKINNNKVRTINVNGDWIYYCNIDDSQKIYKIRTDGTQESKLNNDVTWGINICGDWIYYTKLGKKFYICRMSTDGTNQQIFEPDDSSGIKKNAPKYGGTPSPGKYNDNNITFDYPKDWIMSTNKGGYPLITGIKGGLKYQLSVLDITDDTSSDIFDYTLSKLPVTPVPGGMGSVGSYQIGSYSGVVTGCLYDNNNTIDSLSLYSITDGKKRVVIETRVFDSEHSNYDDQVYQDIINSLIIK